RPDAWPTYRPKATELCDQNSGATSAGTDRSRDSRLNWLRFLRSLQPRCRSPCHAVMDIKTTTRPRAHTTRWCRTGVGPVSEWCQTGVRLVSDRCRTGVGLVSDWCRTGV